MCWYKTRDGKMYSDAELNRAYLDAKKKYPKISPKYYRAKLTAETGLKMVAPKVWIDELVKAHRLKEAAAEWQKKMGWTLQQATNVTRMMADAMGVSD